MLMDRKSCLIPIIIDTTFCSDVMRVLGRLSNIKVALA